jgi:uncharacterized membrane protein
MSLLIAGLILFLVPHSTRIFADAGRTQIVARIGLNAWKGVVTLLSLAGFVLMIIGYDQARATPMPLWQPPLWMPHLTALLMLIAFVMLAATYVPGNHIKAKLHHPMILSVKTWALAHLLANGTLVDLILFGSFLIWAVLDFRVSRQRDRAAALAPAQAALIPTLLTVLIGIVAWAVFAFWLHARWVGVSPLA